MAFGFVGKKVRLVPYERTKHIDNAYRWINDERITEWLGLGEFPLTLTQEGQWFDECEKGGSNRADFAIETLEGEHIGFSNLFKIDAISRTACSGSLIGATEHWGKGYGSDAARIRARYGFERINLRILFSSYLDGNTRSENMQKAAGYVEWGRMPLSNWKCGQYRDHVHTYLTRERWEELNSSSS